MPVDTSKWKLYRAIYDYDGWIDIEGDSCTEVKFKSRLEEGEPVSLVIGIAIKLDTGDTAISVQLEGSKENLDLVMKMIVERDKRSISNT